MKLAGTVLLMGLLAAGVLPTRAAQHSTGLNDLVSVLRISLTDSEYKRKESIIVLPDAADPNLVEALSVLHRTTIDKKDIPYSSTLELPSGYMQLVSVSVVEDKAEFKATLGPVEKSTGSTMGSCGTTVLIPLTKVQGVWVAGQEEAAVC
ncbi:hypothetical protein [Rhodanobacter sp. DHG33]|uniref:hypothetical protein n=1 Tax=Rhodanobacter sp. DHG33 TaxID=2775921 RepID=UPI00177B13D2|nr:hypothetical protein [Rhodanobacter sp. DHG33]MBD8898375.1 hypothetical protein [Rhodanobacter sp. DHG33]